MTVPAHGADVPAPAQRPGFPTDRASPRNPESPDPEGPDPLTELRRAVEALPAPDGPDEAFDAAEHAAGFEAVHDALVAVLAGVDRS